MQYTDSRGAVSRLSVYCDDDVKAAMGVPPPQRETNFISKLLREREREKINYNQNCFVAIRFVRRAHTHNNSIILSYIILLCIYARRGCCSPMRLGNRHLSPYMPYIYSTMLCKYFYAKLLMNSYLHHIIFIIYVQGGFLRTSTI